MFLEKTESVHRLSLSILAFAFVSLLILKAEPLCRAESSRESPAEAVARSEALEASEEEPLITLEGDRLEFATSTFEAKCALCHEVDGTAEGDPRRNLVDEVWHHGGTLEEIERTIREGIPETLMKPLKDKLAAEKIYDLARYVKLLAQKMHVESPLAEREAATALTDSVAALLPPAPKYVEIERVNFIDGFIFDKMKADDIPHAGLSGDAEFMRRLYLDLWGRLPAADAVREFMASTEPNKRNQLIDDLLAYENPEAPSFGLAEDPFLSKWRFFFEDLFKNGPQGNGIEGNAAQFRKYIELFVKYNIPYDHTVREILTATALNGNFDGKVGFLLRQKAGMHEDTCDEIALAATKTFLGVDLQCISCHDGAGHVDNSNLWLSRRKRVEFWRQAAFFGNTQMFNPGGLGVALVDGPMLQPEKGGGFAGFDFSALPNASAVTNYRLDAASELRIARDKSAEVYPQYLLNQERPEEGANPRLEFARMLTSDFQFAKATVNLFWSRFMTVGIVDPPFAWDLDRQDPENLPPAPWTLQPSHPRLLDALARDFVDHNHDLRHLMRTICRSTAYQLSSRFDGEYNPQHDRYYARKLVRRLSAEEIYDAIAKATNVFGHAGFVKLDPWFSMQPWSGYAMDLPSPLTLASYCDIELERFLYFIGRGNRGTIEPNNKTSIVLSSLLLYNDLVKRKVSAGTKDSRVNMLLKETPPWTWKEPGRSNKLVEELFLSTLSRFPTEGEMAKAIKHLVTHRDIGVENLQWVLLNKSEFVVNY